MLKAARTGKRFDIEAATAQMAAQVSVQTGGTESWRTCHSGLSRGLRKLGKVQAWAALPRLVFAQHFRVVAIPVLARRNSDTQATFRTLGFY